MRIKFWLLLGVIVLSAILVFVLGAMPALRTSRRINATLQTRAEKLRNLVQKGMPDEQWMRKIGELSGDYQTQMATLAGRLEKQDQYLERRFTDPDYPGADLYKSAGRWKIVYKQNFDALFETLEESVLQCDTNALEREVFRDEWLEADEMHRYEKRYWIQKAVVDTIVELNARRPVVPVFSSFSFTDEPTRVLQPAHATKFLCLGFRLELAVEFRDIPAIMRALLTHPVGMEIAELIVDRDTVAGKSVASGRGPTQRATYGAGTEPGMDYYDPGRGGKGAPDALPGAPVGQRRRSGETKDPKVQELERLMRMGGRRRYGAGPSGAETAPFTGSAVGMERYYDPETGGPVSGAGAGAIRPYGTGGGSMSEAEIEKARKAEERRKKARLLASKSLVALVVEGYVPDLLTDEEIEKLVEERAAQGLGRMPGGLYMAPGSGPMGKPSGRSGR